jgi:multidrug efflux pump
VFLPLLFWGSTIGEFMKFLPITVLLTLSASLFMALVFVPVLGGVIGKRKASADAEMASLQAAESGDLNDLTGFTRDYVRFLGVLLRHPLATLMVALAVIAAAYAGYAVAGRGVTFFPSVEPDVAQVQVISRDNLSIWEKDRLVRRVEERVIGVEGIEYVYARTTGEQGPTSRSPETIGVLQLDFHDWDQRRPAAEILEEVRALTADIAGIDIQIQEQQGGPSQGKPVEVRLTASDPDQLAPAAQGVRDAMAEIGGFVDVEDTLPLPGVEWRLTVDRQQAARYGADVTLLGQAVQMLTAGLKLAEYRPDDAVDEVDIRVRFPAEQRTLEQLEQLQLSTTIGPGADPQLRRAPAGRPHRRDHPHRRPPGGHREGRRRGGRTRQRKIAQLRAALAAAETPPGVMATFAGEAEEQEEAATFLISAFLAAIFLMLIALVTQFNSLYQAILVMSAIVFSTAGLLLGLLITGRPFGIVMGGIGIIALAGIVVNNNIVLIDTYNEMRGRGHDALEAALRAGAQRLRPVVLTSVTTVLGLMPMVFGMTIDLINRKVQFGAPSTQYWTELSTSIAGGLAFATLLTLMLTPALLVLGARAGEFVRRATAAQAAHGGEV